MTGEIDPCDADLDAFTMSLERLQQLDSIDIQEREQCISTELAAELVKLAMQEGKELEDNDSNRQFLEELSLYCYILRYKTPLKYQPTVFTSAMEQLGFFTGNQNLLAIAATLLNR